MQGEQHLSVKYDNIFVSLTEQKVLALYWKYETNYSTLFQCCTVKGLSNQCHSKVTTRDIRIVDWIGLRANSVKIIYGLPCQKKNSPNQSLGAVSWVHYPPTDSNNNITLSVVLRLQYKHCHQCQPQNCSQSSRCRNWLSRRLIGEIH